MKTKKGKKEGGKDGQPKYNEDNRGSTSRERMTIKERTKEKKNWKRGSTRRDRMKTKERTEEKKRIDNREAQ